MTRTKNIFVPATLLQGMETRAMIACLLALTKIDSERKIKALNLHFVDGFDITNAATCSQLPQPKLSEAIKTLNEVARHCERFHEIKQHSSAYQLTGIKHKPTDAWAKLKELKDSDLVFIDKRPLNKAAIKKLFLQLQTKGQTDES